MPSNKAKAEEEHRFLETCDWWQFPLFATLFMTKIVYKGLYRSSFLATDREDDCRIRRENDANQVIYIEDFCPSIIDAAELHKVHAHCEHAAR